MKSLNINTKSLRLIETFGKKVKQWKHYLPVINLVLFAGVIGLAIICVLLVYNPPTNNLKSEKDIEELPMNKNILPPLVTDTKPIDHYALILSNNPFSPARTAWNPPDAKTETKTETKPEDAITQPLANQQKPKGTPKKITLRGVLILGDTKKALIENPDTTKNKKPFIFIEEGEEIADYKVKNIEPDQIRLDWFGEEQIIVMRSNIKK